MCLPAFAAAVAAAAAAFFSAAPAPVDAAVATHVFVFPAPAVAAAHRSVVAADSVAAHVPVVAAHVRNPVHDVAQVVAVAPAGHVPDAVAIVCDPVGVDADSKRVVLRTAPNISVPRLVAVDRIGPPTNQPGANDERIHHVFVATGRCAMM